MGKISKTLALFLTIIIALSCLALLTIEPTTAYYTSSSLKITSPLSTVAYDNPVDFSIYISDRGLFDWGGPWPEGLFNVFWIGYSLDDNRIVTIMEIDLNSNNYTLWGGKSPPIIASQDISGLAEGQHKIVAYAKGHFTHVYGVSEFEIASEPTYFTIGDTVIPPPTPTPTPTIEPTSINCKSVILNPSTNTSYTDIMPLNFTVEWTKAEWTQWILPRYFYSIDNGSRVDVITEPFPYIYFENMNTTTIAINDTIDVSNLTDGKHSLTLYANGTVNEANLILYSVNFTLSTTHFVIGSLPLSPEPSPVLEITPEMISWSVVLLAVAAVVVFLLLFRRHRKTSTSNKQL